MVNKLLIGVNSLFALLLLAALAVPYVSVVGFPSLSALSLAVPLLVLVNLIFAIYWLIGLKRAACISLLPLVLGYFILSPFFYFRSEAEPEEGGLQVMSFNVRVFNRYQWIDNDAVDNQIFDFVAAQDPDIICFQEFDRKREKDFKTYPYRYVNFEYGSKYTVQAIYSKYPIVNEGSLGFPETSNNAIFADVVYGADTLRVYNLHLQSLKLMPNTKALSEEPSGKLFKRLGAAFAKQQEQAQLVQAHRAQSPYKTVLCGDFNNTQFSNVYRVIKGDMKDSFEEKGSGYGRTLNFMRIPLRIDFILTDPEITVEAHHNFTDQKLSDHFPVMATFSLSEAASTSNP